MIDIPKLKPFKRADGTWVIVKEDGECLEPKKNFCDEVIKRVNDYPDIVKRMDELQSELESSEEEACDAENTLIGSQEKYKELAEALEETVQALIDYEAGVDSDAPQKHIDMMRKARAALAKAKGE